MGVQISKIYKKDVFIIIEHTEAICGNLTYIYFFHISLLTDALKYYWKLLLENNV